MITASGLCFSHRRFVFSFHVFLLDCHAAFEFDHNAVVPDVYPVDEHFHGCAVNRGERITLHRLLYECIEPQPDLSIFGCRSLQLVALCLQFLHPLTVLFDP